MVNKATNSIALAVLSLASPVVLKVTLGTFTLRFDLFDLPRSCVSLGLVRRLSDLPRSMSSDGGHPLVPQSI
jgi:hypothetical protein